MTDWHIFNWIVLGIYLVLLTSLGVYIAGTNKKSDDYFVGARKIPAWVTAFSLYATALSSISFIAMTSNVYRIGWIFPLSLLAHIPLIVLTAYFFVPFARRLKAITAYQYLEARFDRNMRLTASSVFIIFHIMRIAIVIFIPTIALQEAMPNINPIIITLLMGLLCILYTALGGFKAVVWTDVFQCFILFGGAFLVIFTGWRAVPKDISGLSVLAADGKIFPEGSLSWDPSTTTLWALLIGAFFSTIYQWIASQDMVQRYSATKNLKEARKTVLLNIPLVCLSMVMFIGMGSAIYLFYKFKNSPPPA